MYETKQDDLNWGRLRYNFRDVENYIYSKHEGPSDDDDVVVFTRLAGRITYGVAKEVNWALSNGKRVYELSGREIKEITKKVKGVSQEVGNMLGRAFRANSK